MREGDHFELPKFATLADTVGFCEDETTFNVWTGSQAQYGVAELVRLNGNARAVRRFRDPGGRVIVQPGWGTAISESTNTEPAAWIRLDRLPILEPYQAPVTWAELWRAIEQSGAAPEDLLRPALAPIRDGKSHILLVGFPIPARVGEAPTVLHWQPLLLPDSVTSRKTPPGFRNNDQGLWTRDLAIVLRGDKPLSWLSGENWAIDRLGARGQLPEPLRLASVTLVGAGSLGSAVAELLVRGGVHDLHIVDPERLSAGNLVRHTLTLWNVAQHKSEWLARRLNGVSPFARVRFSNREANAEGSSGHVGPKIVLDCTGSDDVLQQLSAGPPEPGTLLVSLSIGLGARRLYALAAPGKVLDFRRFQAAVHRWLKQDLEDHGPGPLPQEGPGCWHPLFPARQDEIAMHAAAAVQELVKWVAVPPTEWTLSVLQRSVSEAGELFYGPGRHAER
ncbi:MAG: ThiF family adenylyltransferase [Phycisphaerales bacterium]|nr:ThiF family adenylyltransferase [Phycisphaerales bacterium]